jgi:2-haloacid dehalogenase
MPSPRPDTVVFDLGSVLIEWNPRHLYRKLFGADTEGMERFLTEVCSSAWNERQDAGRSWQDGIDEAAALYPDQADLIRAFRHRWEEMLGGPMHDSVALLQELRDNGTRLLALTNWSRETFPIAREKYDFLGWFEGILVSGQEGVIKPDPAIYRLLMARFGVEAWRAVFVDDSPRNVEGARQVGMHALQFTGAAKLRRDLNALGLPVQPVDGGLSA